MPPYSTRLRALLVRAVTILTPSDDRQVIRGDLDEWYGERCRRDGRWTARWRLLLELLSIAFRRFPQPAPAPGPEVPVYAALRGLLAGLVHDLRFQGRRFTKNPATTIGATAIVALAIGGAIVVLAVFRTLLWPPAGIPSPDDILVLQRVFPAGAYASLPPSQARLIRDASALRFTTFGVRAVSLRHRGVTRRLLANTVSDGFFGLMGVAPVRGRGFAGRRPGDREVVLSFDLWSTLFGGEEALGTVISVDRMSAAIVGVAPSTFRGPAGNRPPMLWLSSDDVVDEQAEFGGAVQLMVGRDARSIPVPDALWRVIKEAEPQSADRFSLTWTPLAQTMGSGGGERAFVVQSMLVAGILAGLVLFVACANVASALVADGLRRRNEFAMRTAVGASRGRLIAQLLTESVTLSVLAASLGTLGALWALSVLPHWLPTPSDGATMDFTVRGPDLAMAVLLAALIALAAGMVPALRVSKPVDHRVVGPARHGIARLGEVLVVGQVALSVAVTVMAALLIGHIGRLHDAPLGYLEDGRLAFSLQFDERYDVAERGRVVARLTDALAAAPGLRAAGVMSGPAFTAFFPSTPLSVGIAADTSLLVSVLRVDDGYFSTMNAALVRGRGYQEQPGERAEAVVSESVARELWPGGTGLGQVIYLAGSSDPQVVVGVVEDGTYGSRQTVPIVLTDIRPAVPRRFEVLVHGAGGSDVSAIVGTIVTEIDPDLPLPALYPVAEWFERAWVLERAVGDLSTVLSVLALIISGFGLFAFFSRLVVDRTREIGIRRALGASARTITIGLLSRSMVVAGLGFVAGTVLAVVGVKLVSSLVIGIEGGYALAYGGVLLAIFGIASIATLIPIRQANAVDPLNAVRGE